MSHKNIGRKMVEYNNRGPIGLFGTLVLISMLTSCIEEPPTNTVTHESSPSSLLNQNQVPSTSSFANFKAEVISIDPALIALAGSRLFLKLSDSSGEVLFLGEIDRYRLFSLPINIRLDEREIHYELFTEIPSDTIKYGVIAL
jgi:hypothetical protein